ncbi:MAG: NAD-dependent epimerase/dehydratase family protein [Proteobacteria bacterium]|nr:NAD-dependent epimerase/dehydratase family protein [Pseudomonadota bacterium]MBU1299228.1 NAD-dependent epimerase/dehydratase family protein [Bacteroidota bacterium]MBU1569941.1 NAD-dependent epimerase/dehydratase family protein [Pseudomonadota bacterium]
MFNSNKPFILITGATGAIGPRVVHALDQAEFWIRAFSVDTPTAGMFPQSVEVLIGDVTDQVAVQSAMEGVDAVVHMAALLHIVNPPPAMREKYERINVGGTATVVEAAIKAGAKRVVLFSTIAVYGPSDGCVLDEQSPTQPETFYAQTKLFAEQIILNARGADGQPLGTVLRLGAVYGSRIKGNYERLTQALARNRFIPIGNGFNRRTLVYDKDVGRAAALAVSHHAAAGQVFNVTDGELHTLNEIIESICSALGRKPPRLSLPVAPTHALVGLVEKGSHAIGLIPPITREMIEKYIEDIAVDGRRIQKELDFVPRYDLKTGWEETIREMRA